LADAVQVFVDSNQFVSDFLMEGAPFRNLLHFLNNEGHTLLLSRLVVEEVENKYASEPLKALTEAFKSAQRPRQRTRLPEESGWALAAGCRASFTWHDCGSDAVSRLLGRVRVAE